MTVDLSVFREPEEVYLAAIGEPEALALRLKNGAKLTDWERAALVAFIRGELVPPKRRRGQRTLDYLADGTREQLRRQRIKNSVSRVRYIMRELRKHGDHYGRFDEVVDYVSKQDSLTHDEVERVRIEYRRVKPRKDKKDEPSVSNEVKRFHQWLLRTGRLPDFPQRVSGLEQIWILDGGESREWLQAVIDEHSDRD